MPNLKRLARAQGVRFVRFAHTPSDRICTARALCLTVLKGGLSENACLYWLQVRPIGHRQIADYIDLQKDRGRRNRREFTKLLRRDFFSAILEDDFAVFF